MMGRVFQLFWSQRFGLKKKGIIIINYDYFGLMIRYVFDFGIALGIL